MAKGKNTFNLYTDMIGVFEKLPDEKAGQLIKHIFRYVNDQNPETDDLILGIAFEPIKQKLKRDLVKWEEKCEINRENINKRWNKKDTTEYDRIRKHTKHTDKDKDKDKEKEKDKDNLKESVFTFSDFWESYGKKVDRAKAERLYSKVPESDRLLIKQKVSQYVESTPDVQYRKNPTTWLNGKCWNDDVIIPKSESDQRMDFYEQQLRKAGLDTGQFGQNSGLIPEKT